jgi:hypothetical protein
MITFELVCVTPEMAKEWLTRNIDNRELQPGTVDGYARDMAAKNWQVTHQPIAFDDLGHLKDGQHRLWAIVKTGLSILTYVARYASTHDIRKLNVDTQARRKTAFILGCDTRDQETVRSLMKFYANRKSNPTNSEIDRVLALRYDVIHKVCACFAQTTKYRSSSNARAAIVLRCFDHPEHADEILSQYKNFVLLQELDTLWTSAVSLLRFFDGSKALDRTEVFKRVWLAFNPAKHDAKLSRLSDTPAMTGEINLILSRFLGEEVTGE